MYTTYQTIAGITVCMETPWKEKRSENFESFAGNDGEIEYKIVFREAEALDEVPEVPLFKNSGFAVYAAAANGFIRSFYNLQTSKEPYAITKADLTKRRISVDYLPGSEWCFGSNQGDFYYIGWEKLLIREKRMILHAACVETSFGGLLFSGPSGIGKSTQADLWCRFADGSLLNGDKPILVKEQEGWKSYGSPYAGSSKCHVNKSCNVKAVVLLKQAESCTIRRLKPSEAFRRVYSQVTINSWDREFVSTVSDLVMELAAEVEIYELACTPDIRAVELLRNTLSEGAFL